MLVLSAPVTEVTEHVLYPVAKQCVRKLMDDLDITELFKNKLYYQADKLGNSQTSDENHNPLIHRNKVVCNIRPDLNYKNLKWDSAIPWNFVGQNLTNFQRGVNVPIFTDSDSSVSMYEHSVPCSIIIDCKFVVIDSVIAEDIFNRLGAMFTNGDLLMVGNYIYDYKLPNDAAAILSYINFMKGNKESDLWEYLRKGSDKNISMQVHRNLEAKQVELVVNKTIIDNVAHIEFSMDKPNPEASSYSPDTFSVDCTITIQINRPSTVYLMYPIIINNKLVPEFAVPGNLSDAKYGFLIPKKHPYFTFDAYRQKTLYQPKLTCLHLPWYDNWQVPKTCIAPQYDYEPFFIGAVTLDNEDDPEAYTIVDLTKLPDGYQFSDSVLNILREVGDRALGTTESIHVGVYVNSDQLNPQKVKLIITDEGGIEVHIPNLNKQRVHRIVVSEYKGDKHGTGFEFRVALFKIICDY